MDAKRHLETGQASDVQGKSEDKKSEPKRLTDSQKEEESKGITTYFISGTELHNFEVKNPFTGEKFLYDYSKQRTKEENDFIEYGKTEIDFEEQSTKTWTDINGDPKFFEDVAHHIAGDSKDNKVKMLKWSGRNEIKDRIHDALWNGAVRNLIRDAMDSGNYKINFVTHSHGRSVAIQIANKLSELQKSEKDLQVRWLKKKKLGFKSSSCLAIGS
ncbi:MAG: hypothetical protein JSV50_01680 [Desulfobacteraceae bacterium]|nr:MAG: hypothetical protein JSV50_01680 [Desulfobacteraceae bacterium]